MTTLLPAKGYSVLPMAIELIERFYKEYKYYPSAMKLNNSRTLRKLKNECIEANTSFIKEAWYVEYTDKKGECCLVTLFYEESSLAAWQVEGEKKSDYYAHLHNVLTVYNDTELVEAIERKDKRNVAPIVEEILKHMQKDYETTFGQRADWIVIPDVYHDIVKKKGLDFSLPSVIPWQEYRRQKKIAPINHHCWIVQGNDRGKESRLTWETDRIIKEIL